MTTHQTRTSIIKSEAHAEGSMVATKDRHATEAGLDILSAGGNAIDAAIAGMIAGFAVILFVRFGTSIAWTWYVVIGAMVTFWFALLYAAVEIRFMRKTSLDT